MLTPPVGQNLMRGNGSATALSQQGRPQADRHHREDVVGAEERMGDAGHEGAVLGRIEMREGGRG